MRAWLLVLALLATACTSIPAYAEDYAHYFSVAREADGDVIDEATVTVYLADSLTVASIFSDISGTSTGNPFLTDATGTYAFYVEPGLYKVVLTKIGVGTFTTDNIAIGTQLHSSQHADGGTDELELGDLAGTVDGTRIDAGSIDNSHVDNAAEIAESKLDLDFPTHSNTNDPTTNQKAALAGTSGAPGGANAYVTNADSRLTNSRAPTAHAASHTDGGGDEVTITTSQLTGIHAGTNITTDLEEETHATEHQNGGADEISVAGLSGELADAQNVSILAEGVAVGTQPAINLVEGDNVTLTVTDNPGSNRVDVEVSTTLESNLVDVFEGITEVTSAIDSLVFNSAGFDVSQPGSNDALVVLDLSEITVNAQEIQGYPLNLGTPDEGDTLVWDDSESEFVLGGGSTVSVEEGGVEVGIVSILDFEEGFDLGESGGTVSIQLDLSEVTVSADEIQGDEISLGATSDGDTLQFVTDTWVKQSPQILIAEESDPEERSDTISFDAGFDVSVVDENAAITLDLSEVTVSADELEGVPVDMTTDAPTIGQILRFNSSEWVPSTLESGKMSIAEGVTFPDTEPQLFDVIAFSTDFTVIGVVDENDLDVGIVGFTGELGIHSLDTGTSLGQVNLGVIPENTNARLLSDAQKTGLTGGGVTSLHSHVITTAQLESGSWADSKVDNDITISSSGAVDGGALKSGTVPAARLGNARSDTQTLTVAYPTVNTSTGNMYLPYDVTIIRVSGRVRGSGTCTVNFGTSTTYALTSGLSATTTGVTTTTINNSAYTAGSWLEFRIASPCSSTVTEVTISVVYNVS